VGSVIGSTGIFNDGNSDFPTTNNNTSIAILLSGFNGATGATGASLTENWRFGGDPNTNGYWGIDNSSYTGNLPYSASFKVNKINSYGNDVSSSWIIILIGLIATDPNVILSIADTFGHSLIFKPNSVGIVDDKYWNINGLVTSQTSIFNVIPLTPTYNNTAVTIILPGPAGAINFSGPWDYTITYNQNDLVSDNGSIYYWLSPTPSNSLNPPSLTPGDWGSLSLPGATGADGINGLTGATGATGTNFTESWIFDGFGTIDGSMGVINAAYTGSFPYLGNVFLSQKIVMEMM
jgi:hypothetical protein